MSGERQCDHEQCLADATTEIVHSATYPMGSVVVALACDDDRAELLAIERRMIGRRPGHWVTARSITRD